MIVAAAIWLILALPFAFTVAYLLLLSVAGLVAPRRKWNATENTARFAIVVPAHNEESIIASTLRSLAGLAYPKDRFDVHLIADNCTDRTAEIARAFQSDLSLIVHERHDEENRGKGYALQWFLTSIATDSRYDAFVMLDADWSVAENLLEVAQANLRDGASVVQVWCRVADPETSWVTGLRAVAFALVNYLRPLGLEALGLSCGLKGTGMIFDSAVIRQLGWSSFSLTEDSEQHIKLLLSGQRVRFTAETSIASLMPTSLRAARSQNLRWESGKLALLRDYFVPLSVTGIRKRRFALINEVIGLFIPPLSILAASCVALLGLALIIRIPWAIAVAVGLIFGTVLHVVAGVVLLRPPRKVLLALVFAPVFILWKLSIYSLALIQRGRGPWVRTPRTGELEG